MEKKVRSGNALPLGKATMAFQDGYNLTAEYSPSSGQINIELKTGQVGKYSGDTTKSTVLSFNLALAQKFSTKTHSPQQVLLWVQNNAQMLYHDTCIDVVKKAAQEGELFTCNSVRIIQAPEPVMEIDI